MIRLLLISAVLTVSAVRLAAERQDDQMSLVKLDKEIRASLDHIQFVEDLSGVKLEKNEDFHDWLMQTGRQQLPKRLRRFTNNLTDSNMRRRLFYIYKFSVGRDRASRDDFVIWLTDVADWFEAQAESLPEK